MRKECPKATTPMGNNNNNKAKDRAFVLNIDEARKDPDVVSGTFLVNSTYASVLFYSRANKSFVSTAFKKHLGREAQTLSSLYSVELVDGKETKITETTKGCTINLDGNVLPID
jgi:hypothetical protein